MSARDDRRLDPQAAAHLAATAGAPGVASLSVAEARLAGLGYLDLQREAPAMAAVEHRFIPGPTADLPIRVLRPDNQPGPRSGIVVLHGSGWVIANLDVVDEPARVLARDTGHVVVTVNYQKAPEHPFPVPLDDSLAAVRWVHRHAAELGLDPARLALVGDSAGGNLAAAAALELVGSEVRLAALGLLYPALDRGMGTASYREFARGCGLDDRDMACFWDHYAGAGLAEDPRVSPLRAASARAAGLPPAYVATAGHDVLRDEGEAFAERLRRAGVAVRARRYESMVHGFWWMDAVLDEARVLQADLAAFLVDSLAGAPVPAPRF